MLELLLALILSFTVTALMAVKFIPFLNKLKFGQEILKIGPAWHKKKEGTPTMGGILFICGIFTAMAFLARDTKSWLAFIMALFFGFIGFIDDYTKVVKKRNLGLRARQKLLLQILVAVAYLVSLKINGVIDTSVFIPFLSAPIQFGWWFYPFAVFIIVGTVNSVNLTDGIDGLAAGVTVPVCIFFGMISFIVAAPGLGILSAAVTGGLFGFLIYNFHPAKVFMGDTGSLFLGGIVCALGFAYNMPVILVMVGIVYVAEALSDIIQVISYKTTGKRVFKMAPLHHHFERCGWSEERIVYVFSAVTALMCVLAFMTLGQYYYM
jgi:phospho-N-acetylmuramoyl-pentapeptide-transferase